MHMPFLFIKLTADFENRLSRKPVEKQTPFNQTYVLIIREIPIINRRFFW